MFTRVTRSSLLLTCTALLACSGSKGFRVGVEGAGPAIRGMFLVPSGTSPTARIAHTATYNPRSHRMHVFGGLDRSRPLGDMHLLAGAGGVAGDLAWIELPVPGVAPAPRGGHSSVLDPTSDRMIMFGGRGERARTFYDDVWLLANASGVGGPSGWFRAVPEGDGPTSRADHTAVYDPGSKRMIVFGGIDRRGSPLSEVWVLDRANGAREASSWKRIDPAGEGPPGLRGHSAIYDGHTKTMTVFGGTDAQGTYTNEIWVLANPDGSGGRPVWNRLEPSGDGPPPRAWHTAVYAPDSRRMIIFGGFGSGGALNDVWIVANANGSGVPSWRRLPIGGHPPEPRGGHSAVYVAQTNRMVIYGGSDRLDGDPFGDIWVLLHADGEV